MATGTTMMTTSSARASMVARMIGAFGVAAAVAAAVWLAPSQAPGADAQEPIDPADFSAVITNPLFPLSLVGPKVFEGEETDPDTDETIELRLESRLLPETTVVAGVTVAVLSTVVVRADVVVVVAVVVKPTASAVLFVITTSTVSGETPSRRTPSG